MKLFSNKSIFFLCVFAFLFYTNSAQNISPKTGKRFTLSLFEQGQVKTKFRDSLQFDFSQKTFSYRAPLYQKITEKDNSISSAGIYLSPNLNVSKLDLGDSVFSRTLINASLGISCFYHPEGKNIYSFSVVPSANEDEFTINDFYVRYASSFVFMRRVSNKFLYHFGITYTFVFGDGLVIPVLGSRIKLSEKSTLNINLPFSFNYTKLVNEKFNCNFFVRATGGINRYQNKLNVDTTNSIYLFRRRNFTVGGQLNYKFNHSFWLSTQIGLVANQHISIVDENRKVINNFNYNLNNVGFVRLSLIWNFNSSKNYDNEKKYEEELMDDTWSIF